MIRKMTKVIGFMKVFKVIGNRLSHSIQHLQAEVEKEGQGTTSTLVKFEAELYCLSGALKKIQATDEEVFNTMQKMLELILSINYPKQKVLYTALKILSKSSIFFGSRVDLLQGAFKLLANCMQVKKFENEAAEAISNLCKNNKGFVIENLSDFVDCKF